MEMRDRNAQFTPVKQAARCHQKSATAARAASKARARSEHSGGLQRTSAARAGRVDAQLQALWRPVCLHHPDRKSTRLNSSHQIISYAVFCLKKKKKKHITIILNKKKTKKKKKINK